MNEETFPPSPNWYLSNVLTCLDECTIAYGSWNCIVIAKYVPGISKSRTPEVSVVSNAHKERITVIASSSASSVASTYWHCLASAGDDSVVKVWNWDSLTPILTHSSHSEGVKISAMDWSRVDPSLVVSADEQGTVVCWDLFSNTTQRMNFAKLVPTCLSCCPHKRDLIAVGSRSGLVCIINLKGGGKMLHRLRGHDTDVVSLSWCPVIYNVLQPNKSQEDMLLASGAKENTIYIWKAGGGGRYETVIYLPTVPLSQDAPGSQKHRSRLGASAAGGGGGGWACVSWPEPNTILSSSLFGELISCNLQQNLNVKSNKTAALSKLWKLVHGCHGRGLFSIAYVPWHGSVNSDPQPEEKVLQNGLEISENGISESEVKEIATVSVTEEAEQSQVVWTAAQDRQIVACYWKTGKILTEFSTLGGFVYCIATSPLDSNRIAFGVGDGTIRVWNLSNSTSLEVTMLWQKIKGKVMALAWHPTKEGWLAYGTSEGRIGLYDVSCGKPPILLHPYHRRNVYTLCWGPPACKTGDVPVDNMYLYSCGDGEVVQYDPEKPNQEPYNLKELLQNPDVNTQKHLVKTDLAWKPDHSLLAIGHEDGTINILAAPHLKLVHTLISHKKLIQCLAWHPESTVTDTNYSPYQHWLAVGSNEAVIKVFDLSHLSKGGEDGDKQLKHTENCITLSGHLSRVVSMCWSPHIGGHLLSVSYDNTAQLWNVPAQQPIANYCTHNNHVYSCAWSPLDPDLVLTGAADFTLRVWRVSKQTQTLPSERKKMKKLESKKIATAATDSNLNGAVKPSSQNEGTEKAAAIAVSEEESSHPIEFGKNVKEACEASVPQNMKKKKVSARKSFFPVSSQHRSQGKVQHLSNCYHLLNALDRNASTAENEDGTEKGELPFYLGFFGDRDSMQKLLDLEVEYHISSGSFDMAHHMQLWKGNITDMLKEAARQRQLNDWLVSLAPMASQRLWMEMCKSYSEQLTACGQYQKAASYLLVCHKVNEAIDLLVTHHLFREALAIARCRLGPEDPLPKKLVSAWAKHVASEGNYELAVECLISIGELLEAAMLIRKRSDEGSLKLAALIASKAGAEELASMLACQSLKQSLLIGNWTVANEVVAQHLQLKHLKLLVSVHRTIMDLSASNKCSNCAQWLEHVAATDSPLFEIISSRFKIRDEDEKQEIYGLLLKDFRKNESPDTVDKMWFLVSIEVALSFMSIGAKRLHHLVTALNICYQYNHLRPTGTEHFVLELCIRLAPQGPFSDDSIFYSDMSEESRSIMKSMRAYLCVGVVDWVTEYIISAETKNMTKQENENDAEPDQYKKHSDVWCSFAELLNRCINDILTKESLQYFQDCVKIKKWEHEIASAVAKSRKGETTSDGSGDAKASSTDDGTDNILHKLELLKQRKQEFENNFNMTPNPFVIYCKIKSLLAQNDSENYKALRILLENLWKDIAVQL